MQQPEGQVLIAYHLIKPGKMSFTRPCTLFVWAGAKTGHVMTTSAPKLRKGKARINRGRNILHQPERILQEPLSILESISNSNVAECSKYVLCSKLIFWTCRGNSLVTQVFHLTLETTVLGYWINILVFSGRAEKKNFLLIFNLPHFYIPICWFVECKKCKQVFVLWLAVDLANCKASTLRHPIPSPASLSHQQPSSCFLPASYFFAPFQRLLLYFSVQTFYHFLAHCTLLASVLTFNLFSA